jgi:hypothetical protein
MRITALAFLLAVASQESKSALESDPSGWVDLMPGKDLKGWKRIPLKTPVEKKIWTMDEEKNLLVADGTEGIIDMLLHEEERGDGIFHVEWRFRKGDDKAVYNGGVYIRTSADGKSWHQAQVAHAEKPPVVGDLIGMPAGATKRVDVFQKGPSPAKPVGEWNTYEVTCKGKTISLWVNGVTTVSWDGCSVDKGHIGLQAEFAVIEFRSLKYKALQ